jgi:hypothetical protein
MQTDSTCPTVRDPATGNTEQLRLTVAGVDMTMMLPIAAVCRVYSN